MATFSNRKIATNSRQRHLTYALWIATLDLEIINISRLYSLWKTLRDSRFKYSNQNFGHTQIMSVFRRNISYETQYGCYRKNRILVNDKNFLKNTDFASNFLLNWKLNFKSSSKVAELFSFKHCSLKWIIADAFFRFQVQAVWWRKGIL